MHWTPVRRLCTPAQPRKSAKSAVLLVSPTSSPVRRFAARCSSNLRCVAPATEPRRPYMRLGTLTSGAYPSNPGAKHAPHQRAYRTVEDCCTCDLHRGRLRDRLTFGG